MTISVNDVSRIVVYTATAAQTVFAIPFTFYDEDDITVTRQGMELTLNASPADADEYSVTRDSGTGLGSITLGSPGATLSDEVIIYSTQPVKRTSNFSLSGIFNIAALNEQLNKLTIMIGDRLAEFNRSIKAPLGESGYTMAANADLDGKALAVSGQTIIANEASGAAEGPVTITDARTGTAETLAATDAFKVVPCDNASAIALTIPHSDDASFVTGAWVEIWQDGAGAITLTPASGVTLEARDNRLTTAGENASCALRYRGSNVWRVVGDLV